MKPLFANLIPKYYGKPILVICGGPSTGVNLKHIPLDFPACVISANQHGYKQDRFKVDYTVSCDWYFGSSKTRMDHYLREFSPTHINRWSWADYRLPQWTFNGDSGLAAVWVAVLLGGHPVVPLGLDRWTHQTQRYFWTEEVAPGWKSRVLPNVDNIRVSTEQLVEWARGSQVRMFDGPMRAYWPEFNHPVEVLPEFKPKRTVQTDEPGKVYQVCRPIFLHPQDRVDAGLIRLTDMESRPHLLQRAIRPM